MRHEEIDWNTSIEQQVEQIDAAMVKARKLVRQIKRKWDERPELITSEHYSYFQSAIRSVDQVKLEIEINPLYKLALLQLSTRQKRKQQQTIAKYFGAIVQPRVDGHLSA